jgi:hypothetical protein
MNAPALALARHLRGQAADPWAPLEFTIPFRLPGLNELLEAAKGAGGTGRHYSRLKNEIGAILVGLIRRQKWAPVASAALCFRWCEKSRRRDPDNIAAGGRKLILDALVRSGFLPGDGWAHVLGFTDAFELGPQDRVVVTIIRGPE